MPSLWKFAGLTPLQLTRQAITNSGNDEISTRASSLSYYFLLSLFPMLLFLVSLLGVIAGPRAELRDAVVSMLGRFAPGSATSLIRDVLNQTVKASGGIKLAAGILGALWAGSGGMGAVVESLNVINRVEETRSWIKLRLTAVGLTVGLASLVIVAAVLILYGGKIGDLIASNWGLGEVFRVAWKTLESIISLAAMFFSFSVVYYFGPNLKERKWYWQTPGAAVGVFLWLLASVAFRIYLHFFDSYSATYGFIGAVIILMLWLYLTGFAILIGAEVNATIEFTGKHAAEFAAEKRKIEQQLKAA
jgi:membrane protein